MLFENVLPFAMSNANVALPDTVTALPPGMEPLVPSPICSVPLVTSVTPP